MGRIAYSKTEVDLVFAELSSGSPDFGLLENVLAPLVTDDGVGDIGIQRGLDGLLFDGVKDRFWSKHRRR